jgi:hypothetical protein
MLDFAPVMASVTATGRIVMTQCAVTDRQAIWTQGIMAGGWGTNGYERAIEVPYPGDVCRPGIRPLDFTRSSMEQ